MGNNLECYSFSNCSIYIPPHTKPDLNAAYIRSTVRETVRCAEGNVPVYAFFWNCECTHVDREVCTLGLVCVTGQVQSEYCYMKLNTCIHMHTHTHTHARTHTHTHTHTHTDGVYTHHSMLGGLSTCNARSTCNFFMYCRYGITRIHCMFHRVMPTYTSCRLPQRDHTTEQGGPHLGHGTAV